MEHPNPPPTSAQLRAQISDAIKAEVLTSEGIAALERIADAIDRFETGLQAAVNRGATVIAGTLELQ